MLLSPPMPRTSSPQTGAAIQQILVTHCLYDEGLFQKAGFGPRASSTDDALLLRFAAEYPAYELPLEWQKKACDPANAPRRLALVNIPGGRRALIHSVHLPDAAQGRFNNYLSQLLVKSDLTPREALQTWASTGWRLRWDETGTSLPPLPELPGEGTIQDTAVTLFLIGPAPREEESLSVRTFPRRLLGDSARRRALVRQVLHGCELALRAEPGSPRCRLYLRAEPGLAALLLYAAVRLLPEGLATQLTFSTYEPAHRSLRSYRHARIVNTYTGEQGEELDDDLFTVRGYALDTFDGRHSPELDGAQERDINEWIKLAEQGEWATIDKVHELLGKKSMELVSLREAMQAARVSQRLARGEATAEDLLALNQSSIGQPILEEHRGEVWRVVRERGAEDDRLQEQFSSLLRENLTELEERVAALLRQRPLPDWRPTWRLLWSVLREEPGRLREVFTRLLPEPPFPSELRFGLLAELRDLPLSTFDQRMMLPPLLCGCTVEELGQFADSELPRNWLAHALCHGILRPETREFAVRCLHEGDEALIQAFWAHFDHLVDEEQRRAILAPLFPTGDAVGVQFFSRLLRSGCTLQAPTLSWLLETLKVWKRDWQPFWVRNDHLGHFLEMLRGLGPEAASLWTEVWRQLDEEVLLPGNSYQQLLLLNLAALRDRAGPMLPAAVSQAIGDWVALRDHFEKAIAVPESKRQEIVEACTRRGLDPLRALQTYFERFLAPQGMRPEAVEDFIAFYHTFYKSGGEYPHYASRLLGWLRVVARVPDESVRASFQDHYLWRHIPTEFRWRLAEETWRAGQLLPQAYETIPRPTEDEEPDALDGPTRAAWNDEVFQLTGARLPEAGVEPFSVRSWSERAIWLLPALGIGLAALTFAGWFASSSQRRTELALFLAPLLWLLDAVALQSTGLVLRANKSQSFQNYRGRLGAGRGAWTGLCLGLAGGLALGLLGLAWTRSLGFAACLALTAVAGSVLAAVAGRELPARLRFSYAKPWLASGPVVRLVVACCGSCIYFLFAHWLA